MSTPEDSIVVVGAGCSALIVELVEAGWSDITAVDISAAALDCLAAELGDRGSAASDAVKMVVCNVVDFEGSGEYDLWHDRATFHFLTEVDDQRLYARRAANAVRAGGHLLLSGFAPDGPEQCSGLDVARHTTSDLLELFGDHFELIESSAFTHITPWGAEQRFSQHLFGRK